MSYQDEREQKRAQREMEKLQRALAQPMPRGEMALLMNQLLNNVMSLGVTLDTLEQLLVAKGVLEEGQLMREAQRTLQERIEQERAKEKREEPRVQLA